MAPSLLLLLVFPTVVRAWTGATHPGVINRAQGSGKRPRPGGCVCLN